MVKTIIIQNGKKEKKKRKFTHTQHLTENSSLVNLSKLIIITNSQQIMHD